MDASQNMTGNEKSTVKAKQPDLDATLRKTIREAIRSYSHSRHQLCDLLSDRVGRTITISMLENWIDESKWKWHLPADCVPALCDILKTDTLQRQLLSDRLRSLLAVGERVVESAASLQSAQEQIARLTGKVSAGK